MQSMSMQEDVLKGTLPFQDVTGKTPNISEYLDFGFYDHVLYKENAGYGMMAIGRWIGLSYRFGGLVSYFILTHK